MGVLEIHEFCPKGHLSEGVMGLESVEGKLTGKLIYAIGCEQCKKGYFRYSQDDYGLLAVWEAGEIPY